MWKWPPVVFSTGFWYSSLNLKVLLALVNGCNAHSFTNCLADLSSPFGKVIVPLTVKSKLLPIVWLLL